MDQHDDLEHALDSWRGGERLLRRKLTPGWVTDYDHAVALAHLRRYPTLDDLVRVYFDASHVADPDDWLAAARHTRSGRAFNLGSVEDAADASSPAAGLVRSAGPARPIPYRRAFVMRHVTSVSYP